MQFIITKKREYLPMVNLDFHANMKLQESAGMMPLMPLQRRKLLPMKVLPRRSKGI
jgi:hypothetical protein